MQVGNVRKSNVYVTMKLNYQKKLNYRVLKIQKPRKLAATYKEQF